jgi:integron integrase
MERRNASWSNYSFNDWFVYYQMQLNNAIHLVHETCKRQQFALSTEKSYVHWVRRYGIFLKTAEFQAVPAEKKMERFLTRLALEGASASGQNQAFNALLFFYRNCLNVVLGPVHALRAKRPERLRDCPSLDETTRLLKEVRDIYGYPTRLVVHLLYACGLRVSEPLNLRIKDIDLSGARILIRQAKGNKDRVVVFPICLKPALERQLTAARRLAEKDRANGIPVPLPGLLAKKYPRAPFIERWAWVFPSKTISQHPRTGRPLRWRCHEANVQRAVRQAARRCNLDGLTPHCLRHAFASHTLQRGALVTDVQAVLGHVSLETTMGYLHPEASRVVSPLQTYSAGPG